MKPIPLLALLLGYTLCITAQTRTEYSNWMPEANDPSKMNRLNYSIVTTDKDSLVTEVTDYIGDMPDSRKRYTYNDQKKRLSETTYTYKGEVVRITNYTYGTSDKVQELSYSYTEKDGRKIDVKETFAYDSLQRIVRETHTGSGLADTLVWAYEYDTDTDGNKVVSVFKVSKRKRKLDTKSTFNARDLVIKKTGKSYNGNGQTTYTYEYNFDAAGDWTSRKMYEQRRIAGPQLISEYRKRKLD